jgi:hypothetical protein
MEYTPRQMWALLALAAHRKQLEMAGQLSLNALAAQGDSKAIREQLKKWDT